MQGNLLYLKSSEDILLQYIQRDISSSSSSSSSFSSLYRALVYSSSTSEPYLQSMYIHYFHINLSIISSSLHHVLVTAYRMQKLSEKKLAQQLLENYLSYFLQQSIQQLLRLCRSFTSESDVMKMVNAEGRESEPLVGYIEII